MNGIIFNDCDCECEGDNPMIPSSNMSHWHLFHNLYHIEYFYLILCFLYCCVDGSLDSNIVNQEHKDKIKKIKNKSTQTIHDVLTWFGNHAYVHGWKKIIPLYNKEHYRRQNQNITEDRTKYNYWVPETSHVSPLFIFIPYHEPSSSIKYLSFFFTSLFTSYNFYKLIFIS